MRTAGLFAAVMILWLTTANTSPASTAPTTTTEAEAKLEFLHTHINAAVGDFEVDNYAARVVAIFGGSKNNAARMRATYHFKTLFATMRRSPFLETVMRESRQHCSEFPAKGLRGVLTSKLCEKAVRQAVVDAVKERMIGVGQAPSAVANVVRSLTHILLPQSRATIGEISSGVYADAVMFGAYPMISRNVCLSHEPHSCVCDTGVL